MPTIRILPGGRFNENSTVNLSVNGARKDFAIGAVITVTDDELTLIRETGASFTFGDDVISGEDFSAAVAGVQDQVAILAGGAFAAPLTAPSIVTGNVTADVSGDGNGGIRILRSSVAGFTGIVEFLRSDGSRNGYIGFNADAGPIEYGSDALAGHRFVGGGISAPSLSVVDANFTLSIPTANPRITFDANDYIRYDRTANNLTLMIGGVTAALLSANGIWNGDANFGIFYNGGATPIVNFDVGDAIQFDRAGNVFNFQIGATTQFYVNAFAAGAASVFQIGDANFNLSIAGGNPTIQVAASSSIAYQRSTNKFLFFINGAVVASLDASGNMKLAGSLTQNTTP